MTDRSVTLVLKPSYDESEVAAAFITGYVAAMRTVEPPLSEPAMRAAAYREWQARKKAGRNA